MKEVPQEEPVALEPKSKAGQGLHEGWSSEEIDCVDMRPKGRRLQGRTRISRGCRSEAGRGGVCGAAI